MRLLYLVSNSALDPQANTGYGIHIRETIKGLRSHGYEVSVLCSGGFNENIDEHENKGFNIQKTYLSKQGVKRIIPDLIWESIKDLNEWLTQKRFERTIRKFIIQNHPDIIYERTAYLANPVENCNLESKPWFIEVNSPFVEQRIKISGNSIFTGIACRLEARKYNLATHVFCVSNVLLKHISVHYRVQERNISSNPNGVDPDRFLLNERRPRSVNDNIVFGFVGSIMAYHGIDLMIRAFSILAQSQQKVQLLIVGDGALLDGYRQLATDLNVRELVTFTGKVNANEVPKFIDKMDICIMPSSNWYGSPVKLFEYGIMSKPIIAPRVAPVEEVMQDQRDGLLVSNGQELLEAMDSLVNSMELRTKLGINFREKVLSNYCWSNNASRIKQILSEV